MPGWMPGWPGMGRGRGPPICMGPPMWGPPMGPDIIMPGGSGSPGIPGLPAAMPAHAHAASQRTTDLKNLAIHVHTAAHESAQGQHAVQGRTRRCAWEAAWAGGPSWASCARGRRFHPCPCQSGAPSCPSPGRAPCQGPCLSRQQAHPAAPCQAESLQRQARACPVAVCQWLTSKSLPCPLSH